MKYKHKKSDDFEILEHMELSFLWATDPNFLLFILVICVYVSDTAQFNTPQNLKEIGGKVFIDEEPEICPPEVIQMKLKCNTLLFKLSWSAQ